MPFPLIKYRYTCQNTAADEQQCDPQHEIACVAGLGRLRQLSRYGVGLGDFLVAVLVFVILIAAAAVPILDIALGILGCRLCGDMLQVGVVLRVRFSVSLSADLANRFFGAGRCTSGMPVVDRYAHFGGVARLVGDNDPLLAVRRREDKTAVFVKRDLCAVYGAVYAVKVMPSSSAFVNSLFDSRYSTVTDSPLLSAALIVTVCVSLKNSPKSCILLNSNNHPN